MTKVATFNFVGSKVCTGCGCEKDLSRFSLASESRSDKKLGIRRKKAQCKECSSKYSQEYHRRDIEGNRAKDRAKHYSRKYGVSLADSIRLANPKERFGCCPICHKASVMVLDHDHSTGKVRDLICSNCNSMLGMANDNVESLKRAIDYLEVHNGTR